MNAKIIEERSSKVVLELSEAEEYWLQFGNFDPFAKALTRAAFRNN